MSITLKKGRKTITVETQAELDAASLDGFTVVGGGVIADGSQIPKTSRSSAKTDEEDLFAETYEDLPVENLIEQIKARGLATEFGVEPVLADIDLKKVDAEKLRAGLIADDEKNAANA